MVQEVLIYRISKTNDSRALRATVSRGTYIQLYTSVGVISYVRLHSGPADLNAHAFFRSENMLGRILNVYVFPSRVAMGD